MKEKRRSRGFTLTEMLVSIAMLAILAGLLIPVSASMYRRFRLTEMDDFARQICVAAQNELTAMKATGRLEAFAKQTDQRLTQQPQDYPKTDNDGWKDLYTVYSADQAAEDFLLRAGDSLSQATEHGGYFLLELNPLTGDVYSAFYSEQPFTYEQISAWADRSRETRLGEKDLIGYYSAASADYGAVGVPEKFCPTIELIDGEELYVKIDCGGLMALRRTQRNLTVTLTVKGASGGEVPFTYRGGTDFFVERDSITLYKVLDSLDEDNAFAAVFKNSGIKAGDDITVQAAITYDDPNQGLNITGETGLAQGNSLFGAVVTGDDGSGQIQVSRVRHLNNLQDSILTGDAADAAKACRKVVQTAPISFLFQDWKDGDWCPASKWTGNPMGEFRPIQNQALFGAEESEAPAVRACYDGQNNVLKGFVFGVNDHGRSALFGTASHTDFQNIRLADCQANGMYAAMLGGYLSQCSIENCGAYLTTQDENGSYYNDMDDRRARYMVQSNDLIGQAGGLAAYADRTTITASFGAVDVTCSSKNGYAGGLAGYLNNCHLEACYASGNISAPNRSNGAGGLVGTISNDYQDAMKSSVKSCYATGHVTADQNAGGLLGRAAGTVSDCVSYGKVTTGAETEDTSTSGGFIGNSNGALRISDCCYLSQAKYNATYHAPNGVTASGYSALKETAHVGESHPYSVGLRGLGIPFPLCQYQGNRIDHYGDWPEAYQLQTSLVYYEKYADGSYGYYARTSLTSGGQSAGSNWIADTLKDRPCVEDGYALMTVYELSRFSYTLDVGDRSEALKKGDIAITTDPAACTQKQAALLRQGEAVDFVSDGQTVEIQNAKLYRLPFDLQINKREAAYTFWETLTVTGYGPDSSDPVVKNETFYYCPDFARNAVNPEPGVKSNLPQEPGGPERPVYVRSARQLNGMSRSTYYWNLRGGGTQIQFVQETDLDYQLYTKRYCGVTYDLMDTSEGNPYKNQPIGTPNVRTAGGDMEAHNFRNSYDGRGHKIIDYCCETYNKAGSAVYRFTGLFGEAEQCTLKNIVMVASDPANRSGYVRATNYYGNYNEEPAVGALIGLAYKDRDAPASQKTTEIINCTVSGYEVSFQMGGSSKDPAVGGLVGINFGSIVNSSATCSVSINSSNGHLGGLAGSLNGTGSIDRCYAGGTLRYQKSGQTGGLVGGFVNVYGYGQINVSQRDMRVSNSYAANARLRSNMPATGTRNYSVVAPSEDGDVGNSRFKVSNCYYLSDPGTVDIDLMDDGTSWGLTDRELGYLTMDGFTWADAGHTFSWSASLSGKAYPYPTATTGADGQPVHYGDWYGSGTAAEEEQEADRPQPAEKTA
ncbi:pilus assembly FimT family protein [Flintibacter faecis]|uniref:pilus assembly FimT family protein n=1 Tax=Flintibacter faecis TaxID=2763047 RepID=UPI001A9B9F6F